MSSFDGQNTDRENAKPVPSTSKPGDDLKSSSRGSAQAIASEDYLGQQKLTGNGADAVTASVGGGQP